MVYTNIIILNLENKKTMKVKINNEYYDSNETPIMLILSEEDKNNISMMHENASKFCSYPADYDFNIIQDWMDNINPIRFENELHTLEKAHQVLTDRDSDKAKEYGDFHESMSDAASIASVMTGLNISAVDFYKCMMALKLARLRHSHKHDTFLDLIAYTASLEELINKNPSPNERS